MGGRGAGVGAGAVAPPGAGGPGWLLISMVPLNFGAAAPFRLTPHFVHVDAVSEFCVPQFGQNTHHLRQQSRRERLTASRRSSREGTGKTTATTSESMRSRQTHADRWNTVIGNTR